MARAMKERYRFRSLDATGWIYIKLLRPSKTGDCDMAGMLRGLIADPLSGKEIYGTG